MPSKIVTHRQPLSSKLMRLWSLLSYHDLHTVNVDDRPSSIDVLSDEDVYDAIANTREEDAIGFLNEDMLFRRDSIVYPISNDAVFKYMCDPEVSAMTYVAAHTSIPIPRVRRVLAPRPSEVIEYEKWVVMDRVDGEPLARAWPTMSWWGRLRVIWYMRDYIRQLHSIPIPYPDKPGPFDAFGRRHPSIGTFCTSFGAGPFESYEEMADWFDQRRFDAMVTHYRRWGTVSRYPKFDRTQPLVVCHMDLNLRNIMVDRSGIPWIIDWGEAGAYPTWLEYARAAIWDSPGVPSDVRSPWLWKWAMSFMFGKYGGYLHNFLYPIGKLDIWDEHPYNYPLDYFSELGIDID